MSKDLKKEYNDMLLSGAPDLWDRISSNLPEKAPKKNRTRIYRFAAIAAAACICVAVAVPVAINMTRVNNAGMSSGTSGGTASAQAAAAETTYKEEAKAEFFPDAEESIPEKASAAAAEPETAKETQDTAIAEAADSGVFDYDEAAAEAEVPAAAESSAIAAGGYVEENAAEGAAEAEEAAAEAGPVSVETCRISVTVLEESESIDGSALYIARVVLANASGAGPGKGETINIKTDADTPAASIKSLASGKNVIVDLEATEKADTWILR